MDIIELIAIIILIAAIVFLIYYYIESTNGRELDIKKYFEKFSSKKDENISISKVSPEPDMDEEEKISMGDKVKYVFKDIDKSYLNTDAFSKRLDSFLDEKSEELIENWSLVTTDELEGLEKRCITACDSIDELEKRFSDYSKVTDEKISDLDNRLKVIEEENELLEEE